ncbi:DUF6660 family protein [Kordia sp.]|uniref:DUF6660 family protein n=1 Tax=Kordia sp. TaxID=1965332 RepID=UPI003D6C6ABE
MKHKDRQIIFAQRLQQIIHIFDQMKFLAAILSIYIFTLNFLPCGDSSNADNEIKIEISHDVNDDHGHQDSDLCSPFCHCNCCHINVMQFKIVDFTLATIDISTKIFHYSDGLIKNFNPTILQPPQV